MTVRQLLEEYHKLPPKEQEELRAEIVHETVNPQFMPREKAKEISRTLFAEYDDLFRKLAK